MGDPISLALGGLVAATSVAGASSANSAAQDAADAEKATQDIAAKQRKAIIARELQTLEGSLRASSAGRGVAGSATESALSGAVFESALLEGSAIELNRFTQNAATQARADAQQQSLFTAGISGFTSGVGLGQTLGGLDLGFGGGASTATQGFAGLNPQLPDTSGIGFA